MKQFNVINYNFNTQKFEYYDVIPYLVHAYDELVERNDTALFDLRSARTEREIELAKSNLQYWKIPKTFDEFKKFVRTESQYQFWSRCEYEIILVDWPCQKHEEKWDVYDQIMMNIDIITQIVMEETAPCVPE